MKTLADRIIAFNKHLEFNGSLPLGVSIMNPFKENAEALKVSSIFYRKYYSDNNQRHIILGINPGRFGSAVTGVPFTDTKRLTSDCGIPYSGKQTHEPSSVFIYDMIRAYGGTERFYSKLYIHSICPLGFTATNNIGNEVNHNYYDSKALTDAVYDFIIDNINKQIALGMNTDICFCFGTGKNEQFLRKLNDEYKFFKQIVALEHPRYIMQYKTKSKQQYIDKYLAAFSLIKQ